MAIRVLPIWQVSVELSLRKIEIIRLKPVKGIVMGPDITSINKGFRKLKNECRHKECFFTGDDCSSRIIKAHSIQHKRILSKLAVNGYVTMIDFNDTAQFDMKKVGKRTATTFSGFCGKHDGNIFGPIETSDYCIRDKEQEFLFAYRALAKEHSAKKTCFNFADTFIKMYESKNFEGIKEYFPDFQSITDPRLIDIYNNYIILRKGYSFAIEKYESYREAMNKNIQKGKFHSINTFVLEFPTETLIAVSSLINITHDVRGKQICDLADNKSYFAPLFLTIFPQEGKTYVLLSCYKNHKGFYDFIDKQIVKSTISEQKTIISNMIAMYCENMAISPNLWDHLGEGVRKSYERIFSSTIFGKDYLLKYPGLNIFK